MSKKDLAIIILAAGSSKRLGMPKQLVKYKNESLLEISVKKALKISENVFVVLGHKKEECEKEISKYKINILYNKDYAKGIGTSISFGIKHTKEYDNSLIMLCDQPFMPIEHFNKLSKNIQKNTIIASLYEENLNSTVPAIFPKKYYEELLKLKKDAGAKEILNKNICINIKLKKINSVDIDTPNDIKTYIHNI